MLSPARDAPGDRYNIIDEGDLARSVELAFNGKQAANTPSVEEKVDKLS